MSISTMTRLMYERQDQDQLAGSALEGTRGAPETQKPGDDPEAARAAEKAKLTAVDKLAGFVPTEIVTGWAAAVGLLVPTAHWQRWAIFAGAVATMIVLIVQNSVLLRREPDGSFEPAAPGAKSAMVRLVFLSTIAFTIWAFAAPGSPAVVWGDGATRIFAVVAVLLTPVLHRAAQIWGLAPIEAK